MATVINDFTIEPKASPPADAQKQPAAAGGGGNKPSQSALEDLARAMRRARVRAMRVWAH